MVSESKQHNAEGEAVCVPATSVNVELHLHRYGIITTGAASACKQHTQTVAWYAPQRRLFLITGHW